MAPPGFAWPFLAIGTALAAGVFEVDKPAGCSTASWTTACFGAATCESLSGAGLQCDALNQLGTCGTVCAEPCCITTTSTTMTLTMTATTLTTTETTVTRSSITVTHTSTETQTTSQTDTTISTTGTTVTSSYTGSSITRTVTMTRTHTMTMTSTVSETETSTQTTTEVPITTQGAAAKITVTMSVTVPSNEAQSYVQDSRVSKAYKKVMEKVTGLSSDMVDVELEHSQPTKDGNLTVTYTLTIPYEDQGNGLVAAVPLKDVQDKLAGLDLESLNAMLDEQVAAATGSGKYTQEVERLREDQTSVVNGAVIHFSFATSMLVYFAAVYLKAIS